jgi:glycosyltransferase involved in cell wall biosynthesis
MRVALLANYVPPYRIVLYEEMQRRFAEFRIFVSTRMERGRYWPQDWADLPVHVQKNLAFRGTWRHPNHFSEPLTIQVPYDTFPLLSRFRPDVIISSEMGIRTLQAAIYCRVFKQTRLIIWAMVSEVTEQGRGTIRHWLRARLLRRADAVIVNGESGARYIQRFGVSRDRLVVVPYTTALGPFLAIPAERGPEVRRRLLYSGMLTERKGLVPFLRHLADFARRHPAREIEFDIVGDGPLRHAIATFPPPPNLKIRMLGHVSYDQLPSVYRGAGILVFPTLADEWGLVVTEAMASGVVVLGSLYSQAVEELVKDGENGWTFRPDLGHDMAAKLEAALGTPFDRLDAMAERARSSVCDATPAALADRIARAAEISRRQPKMR